MNKVYIIKPGDNLSSVAKKLEVSLNELLEVNIQFKNNPNKIKVGDKIIIPEKSPVIKAIEASAILTKTEISPNIELGSLSAKYEVGNRGSATVSTGIGDAGGASYGSYQMTSKPNGGTVARFINQLDSFFKDKFQGLIPGSTIFTNTWKSLVANNPIDFKKLEHDFIKKTHYDVLVSKIFNETGIDINKHSNALQNVVWSTAVQHGGNSSIVQKAFNNTDGLDQLKSEFDRKLIEAIYNERGRKDRNGNLVYFGRNSLAVQKGVANRFINEKADALRMLNN